MNDHFAQCAYFRMYTIFRQNPNTTVPITKNFDPADPAGYPNTVNGYDPNLDPNNPANGGAPIGDAPGGGSDGGGDSNGNNGDVDADTGTDKPGRFDLDDPDTPRPSWWDDFLDFIRKIT